MMKFFTCTFIAFMGLFRDKISDKQRKVNWPEMLQLIFKIFSSVVTELHRGLVQCIFI